MPRAVTPPASQADDGHVQEPLSPSQSLALGRGESSQCSGDRFMQDFLDLSPTKTAAQATSRGGAREAYCRPLFESPGDSAEPDYRMPDVALPSGGHSAGDTQMTDAAGASAGPVTPTASPQPRPRLAAPAAPARKGSMARARGPPERKRNAAGAGFAQPSARRGWPASQSQTLTETSQGFRCPTVSAGCLSPGAPGTSYGTTLETGHFAQYYQPTKLLGQGNFGTVYKCTHLLDENEYAVKCIATTGSMDMRRKLGEARQLAKCIDIHIVRLLDCWQESKYLYLKLEYCAHGNLVDVYMRGPHSVDDNVLWSLLDQIGRALAVVHAQGFAHLDVKPPNIFVASLGRKAVYKLGDFGLCRSLPTGGDSQMSMGSIQEGDGRYMPQDIYNDKSHAQQADVFALGMSVYELTVQEEMRGGDQETLRQPGEVARRLDGKCHPRILMLVSEMVDADPSKRPTAAALRLKRIMKDSDGPVTLPSGDF
eukprot:TRINITY_DN8971_c0_g2_i3.p1 TRINITY_DN8971_c0_g2~~TRINITY_DN8971_c0_g2_i3.p1  ORF type:complete len:482 (+),score=149.49 TRINITY_DN8971_c0_g2_i3:110-1555(+)